jgi:hypothetical protein
MSTIIAVVGTLVVAKFVLTVIINVALLAIVKFSKF